MQRWMMVVCGFVPEGGRYRIERESEGGRKKKPWVIKRQ